MKLGLSIKIDVNKIIKERLYKGERGTYLDLTTFIDLDQKDQYDNNGFIAQSTSKEERENKVQTPILGNVKVFFNDQAVKQSTGGQSSQSFQSPQHNQQYDSVSSNDMDDFEDGIPF